MEKIWLKNYQEGVPVEINPDEYKSLTDLLVNAIKEHADKDAFINMGNKLKFSDLDKYSEHFATYLQRKGFKKGDRFAIMLPNILQFPVALIGALKAGLIIVNVNPMYTVKELSHILVDSKAKGIITLNTFAHTVEKALAFSDIEQVIVTEIGDLFSAFKRTVTNFAVKYLKKMVKPWDIPDAVSFREVMSEGMKLDFFPIELNHDDIAFLQYTGGTTGRSKGAILTHKNLISNIMQAMVWITPLHQQKALSNIITPLPLYHVFSLTANCLSFIKLGSTSILITNPRDIDGFIKELNRYKFNAISGVNTLFNALLQNPKFADVDFSNLVLALGGGMSIQKVIAQKWFAVTGTHLSEGYGLTEASPIVCINPLNIESYTGSIGLPVSSTDVYICDNYGNSLPLGQEGELWVKGPQVMEGYWNNPKETDEVLTSEGWLCTGDIAKMDEEGYIYIVDRKKDMILVSGFNVYPNEVEEAIVEHEAVKEVAVVGVKYKDNTELVKACIVLNEGYEITKQEITEHCRGFLTSYKVPRIIEFLEDLPKTNVGKVLRRELRED